MIPTLIKSITLTYIITDIYITVICINITGKYPLPTAPRAYMACITTTVFF